MQREVVTGRTTISDAALVAALIGLNEAEGERRDVHCRFGLSIAGALVSLGLAMFDRAPEQTAVMRVTLREAPRFIDPG